MTLVERAEQKADLLRQAVALVERLHANEAEHFALLGQRNTICRELKKVGASGKELAEATGMSRSRVQQILRETEPRAR